MAAQKNPNKYIGGAISNLCAFTIAIEKMSASENDALKISRKA